MHACGVGLRTNGVDELTVTGARVIADVQIQTRRAGVDRPTVLRRAALRFTAQIADQANAEAGQKLQVLLGGAAEGLRAVQNALAHASATRRRVAAEIPEIRQTVQGQRDVGPGRVVWRGGVHGSVSAGLSAIRTLCISVLVEDLMKAAQRTVL